MSADEIEGWYRDNEWTLRWHPEKKPPTKRSVPNGHLKLALQSTWEGDRTSWSEGPRGSLDRKLGQFFAEIERRARKDDQRAEERHREELVRQQQELDRLEREQFARIEQERVERLLREVRAWRLAADATAYSLALRERLSALDPETRDRLARWCDWIDEWVAHSDPTLPPQH
jgi:hypothetical protein